MTQFPGSTRAPALPCPALFHPDRPCIGFRLQQSGSKGGGSGKCGLTAAAAQCISSGASANKIKNKTRRKQKNMATLRRRPRFGSGHNGQKSPKMAGKWAYCGGTTAVGAADWMLHEGQLGLPAEGEREREGWGDEVARLVFPLFDVVCRWPMLPTLGDLCRCCCCWRCRFVIVRIWRTPLFYAPKLQQQQQ